MEQDALKRIYEDTIFNNRFLNSNIIKELEGRTNKYNNNKQVDTLIIGSLASAIVQSLEEGDGEVARGIAIGIQLAEPNFGKLGEEFLKKKLPKYNKSKLGVALTKVVEDVLNGKEEISEEGKAAQLANIIYNDAQKIKDPKERRSKYTLAITNALEGTKKNNTVSVEDVKYYDQMREKESEIKEKEISPEKTEEMEENYKYYNENFNKMPETFKKALKEECSKEEIIAYYVASRSEEKLHKLYVDQNKKDER